MVNTNVYYRPIWTCGRYNEKHQVAIYYNLIAGMAYLFESYSAMVVGEILATPRNGEIEMVNISSNLNIALESLEPFFEQLEQMGIVSSVLPTDEIIVEYRRRVSEYNCQHQQMEKRTIQEKLPFDLSNAEQLYAEKVGGITSVMFELTYRCSEKCIHCYNIGATRNDTEVSHRGDLKELTFEDYKRIIDELYEEGLTKVCLSGGDPFAKSIVWDIIDNLHEKEIAIDIFTNGQSIVNEVEHLANYYPRLVGVSIYSGNSITHDKITRVIGSWERSISVVKKLSELAIPTVLKCCVMRPNVHNYYTVMDIAKEYGLFVQYELNVTDSIDGDKCVSHFLRLTPDMLDIVLQDDNTPMYVGKEAPNYGGQSKDMNVNGCGAGMNTFCITPNGDLIPCCAFHLKFGNLCDSSVTEILNQNDILRFWQKLTLEQYEECGKHEYCAYCNLCPGINYSEHGDVRKAGENNCYTAKCRWSLANRLMKGEAPISVRDILKKKLEQFSDFDCRINKIKREKG